MKIENILKENLESFYPWSDNDTPPLDTNKKTFVEKERETLEDLEGWRMIWYKKTDEAGKSLNRCKGFRGMGKKAHGLNWLHKQKSMCPGF